MSNHQLYAISEDDSFENPIFCFGEKNARQLAEQLNGTPRIFDRYRYIAKVAILPDHSFEYYDCDGL